MKIFTFDTTLRDGTQGEAISFSVDDKLVIAQKLDDLGIDYIEGGWPGSNPKDEDFFKRASELNLKHAKLTAFGSTRFAKNPVEVPESLVEHQIDTRLERGLRALAAQGMKTEDMRKMVFDFLWSQIRDKLIDLRLPIRRMAVL